MAKWNHLRILSSTFAVKGGRDPMTAKHFPRYTTIRLSLLLTAALLALALPAPARAAPAPEETALTSP